MPTARKLLAGLALALTAISCSDDRAPTAPTDQGASAPTAPKISRAPGIFESDPPQTFAGVSQAIAFVKVTHFYYEEGQLFVDGQVLAANGAVIDNFSHEAATLTRSGAPTQPTCQILNLDIGEIHLNVLGLDIVLAPVHLDITGQTGQGRLLGNLLCALAGLLDPGPVLGGLLTALQNLLNQINAILAGL
ncbi:MAG: hypothetical protein ACJ8A6_03175 [Gemmatimonadales bacterium]